MPNEIEVYSDDSNLSDSIAGERHSRKARLERYTMKCVRCFEGVIKASS